MCGPADYVALQTCLARMAELSAAGLTACTLYRTGKSIRDWRKARRNRPGKYKKEAPPGETLTESQ